jgi:hypothetical protein
MSERQRFGNSTGLDFLVSHAANPTLAVGPLVWQPSVGNSSKHWYFWAGSCDATAEFHATQLVLPDHESELLRLTFIAELMARPPLVIHGFDDELIMARWCEALWPGERISRTRRQLEQGRGVQV